MTALLLLLLTPALAQEIAWDLKPSTTSAQLGETVTLAGTVRHPLAGDLALNLSASATDFFSISSATQEPGVVQGGSRTQRFRLEILPLAVGRIPITTLWELKRDSQTWAFQSPPVFLDVAEPPLDPQLRIRDIKAPRPARPALWPWLLAAALAAGAYLLFKKRLGRKAGEPPREPKPADTRPPEVIANSELSLLESSGLWAEGRHKEFYIRLTDILRRYLERRFGIPATRLTTAELNCHIRHAEIDRNVCLSFKEVFDRADLVKFAKRLPAPDWGPTDLEAARRIVEETTPRDLVGGEVRA